MPEYAILEAPDGAKEGYQPYGGAREAWLYKGPELMLEGPAETGKTRLCLEKLNALLWKYAGSQAAIVRKTRQSMTGSVLQTYEMKVLGPDSPVKPYGGQRPEQYIYPNGSRIFIGGMDTADKVLSSERDFIYINQCEELTVDDYEKLTSRCTGRAGNAPYPQIIADANPQGPKHWILERAKTGRLHLIKSRHEDNPILFDPGAGGITEQGRRSLAVLDALTGVRYLRLRKGLWAAAEGAIYTDWDRGFHIIEPFEIPWDWVVIRSIDFGYVNPFVCQWWAIDPDGRMYLYREIYSTGRIVADHARVINTLSDGENITATVADHDAEDMATLRAEGIYCEPANKAVKPGIEAVQARMRRQADGRARIYFFRDALVEVDEALKAKKKPLCTDEEVEGYVWEPEKEGKTAKEAPVKVDDHGLDAARYAAMYVDQAFGFDTIPLKGALELAQKTTRLPGM